MTEGSLGSGILLFAIPLMLTSILQLLYSSADMIVVGQFEGKVAVGAIGSTTSLLNLFINLVVGFGNADADIAHLKRLVAVKVFHRCTHFFCWLNK